MPALAHVITQNRDGCAFDEVSDAVDEGRAPFRQLDILDYGPRSRTLPASTVNVQKLKLRVMNLNSMGKRTRLYSPNAHLRNTCHHGR
jgi:hypothetical protein